MKTHRPFSLLLATLALGSVAIAYGSGCTITSTSTPVDGGAADGGLVLPTGDADASDGGGINVGEAGGDGGAVGCGFGEPNDTRETATTIQLNQHYNGLCVSSPDHTDEKDFFEFTAPAADAAGGYVEVLVSNVQNQAVSDFILFAVADNGTVVETYTTDEGASVTGWATVTPGAKYRVQVTRFGGAGDRFAYDLFVKYTKINDTFEPNNKKEDAKTISVNTPIQASPAAHSPSSELTAGDDFDWYKVTLAAGNATIELSQSPSDSLCDVELFDSTGQKVKEDYTTTPGANCKIDATNLLAGSYFVNAHSFGGTDRAKSGAPTPRVTQLYTLQVKQ